MTEELTQRLLTTTHTIGKASRQPVIRTYLSFGVSDEHTLATKWPVDPDMCVFLGLLGFLCKPAGHKDKDGTHSMQH
jgi:hypothetical protein